MWIEILGYIGMGLILISFAMKDVKWLRIINIVGSVFSVTYGLLTRTIPTACLNCALIIINFIYLIIYLRKKN